ncbi:hypothetical protein GCM10025787_38120 [Saccharopolyspora rosea]|uniref:WhiB family transcriptional regulator n=1 Tax=Saccharopolyspora rosea TaxID=524884 RepID=A0ABW3FN47_9PSEU
MKVRLTKFLREQLRRANRFADADGWKLLDQVETTPERNCVDVPVGEFFPSVDEFSPGSQTLHQRDKIGRLCHGCPVADECLAGALLRGERYGGWGGVAQPDFQALRRLWRQRYSDVVDEPDASEVA